MWRRPPGCFDLLLGDNLQGRKGYIAEKRQHVPGAGRYLLESPRKRRAKQCRARTAEIICVGTELLMGSTLNTNATEIAAALAGIGLNLYHSSVVGDNKRLAEARKAGAFPGRYRHHHRRAGAYLR